MKCLIFAFGVLLGLVAAKFYYANPLTASIVPLDVSVGIMAAERLAYHGTTQPANDILKASMKKIKRLGKPEELVQLWAYAIYWEGYMCDHPNPLVLLSKKDERSR